MEGKGYHISEEKKKNLLFVYILQSYCTVTVLYIYPLKQGEWMTMPSGEGKDVGCCVTLGWFFDVLLCAWSLFAGMGDMKGEMGLKKRGKEERSSEVRWKM